jgi:RimJ/RimL family protein N-acetyltransferase
MIRLERFTRDDIDRLIGWITTPEFLIQWAGPEFGFPLDRRQLEKHIKLAGVKPPDRLIFKIADPTGVIGHVELGAIDRLNRAAKVGRVLIGTETRRGRGAAAEALEILCAIAFEDLNLHRLELAVYDFNHAAIRCYEKVGFRHEGLRRDSVRMGEVYWNTCVMGFLAPEWRRRDPSR